MTRISLMTWAITAGLLGGGSPAVAQSSSAYASAVVEYVEGTGIPMDWLNGQLFNDPSTALGRPTADTTGDGFSTGDPFVANVPVVPANAPFRSFEVVSIGQGGRLTVQFDHPVVDDRKNPCGLDFTIFGNAFHIVAGGSSWTNGDPNGTALSATVTGEPGLVSVSQDGITWFVFSDGPYADDFAATLGRVYDPAHPDPMLGAWNFWWGGLTDPTRPLPGGLTASSLAGHTVAEVAQIYGSSAGGTGYDIGQLGLAWIQYVKIENPLGSGITPEIDALADVAPAAAPADFNCDDRVSQIDFDHFEDCQTGPGLGPPADGCENADFDDDEDVDGDDFGLFQRCYSGLTQTADPNCMD